MDVVHKRDASGDGFASSGTVAIRERSGHDGGVYGWHEDDEIEMVCESTRFSADNDWMPPVLPGRMEGATTRRM